MVHDRCHLSARLYQNMYQNELTQAKYVKRIIELVMLMQHTQPEHTLTVKWLRKFSFTSTSMRQE
jgi:hypothetical protein